jgi:mannose-6-phosphate isomerase-like protein (cupin superfamily)
MDKVNLFEKLGLFSDHWKPRVIGELNGQHLKLAKFKGEFIWHRHESEDELFLLLSGTLAILLRDRTIQLEPGELFIVPKGVEHKPVAETEAQVLLLEPAGTRNTGDVHDHRTVGTPESL